MSSGRTDCPCCRARIDAQTSVTGEGGPQPGDFSVCLYCAAILRFTDDLQLRVCRAEELLDQPLELVAALSRTQQAVMVAAVKVDRVGRNN